MKKFLNDNFQPIADQVATEMSDQLQIRALKAGWPVNVVRELKVVYEKDAFKVTYPDTLKNEVFDLEYGQPDKGLIRKFLFNYRPAANRLARLWQKEVFS